MSARISDVRIAKDWSQAQLARKANVSRSTISRLERGIGTIKQEHLDQILLALEVTSDDIEEVVTYSPVKAQASAQKRRRSK